MRGNWMARVIKIMLFAVIAFVVFGFVVMALWNWLMPALFGLRHIGFWQAVGLVILSKILFGSFHSHGGRRMHWRRRMRERWEHITPAEREKFQTNMRAWCGAPKPEPKV